MMSNKLFDKSLVFGVLFLFICGSVVPCVSVVSKGVVEELVASAEVLDEKSVTFYVFDKKGNSECDVVLSSDDFDRFFSMFEELNHQFTCYPYGGKTEFLKCEFVDMLDGLGMIPDGFSRDDVVGLINYDVGRRRPLFSLLPLPSLVYNGKGSAFFCNFATAGEGSQFPVVILPRLIPILLTPIPRVIMHWNAVDGVTSCGGLLSGRGFIALGAQVGTALGFWGVGFSVFLPPFMNFGFIGYALFATATAEVIQPWPPNRPPVISEEYPLDDSLNVPVSLSELKFRIEDADGDSMNYSVTTDPYIGSGSGSKVVDGVYSVPVSGLDSNTEYSWHIVVTDEEDTTEVTFSFRTQIEPPFVSDPLPVDGDGWVSVDISELSFRLEDFQGDLMDYTVETVPNIGSCSATGVGDGTYSMDVSGLVYTTDYTWFVNVTDGKFWTRKVFVFKTQPILVFDPFDEGWQYRKQITINHSQVAGDLSDFPVLISLFDVDLCDKSQVDGDDILFMDGSGVANRLLHEIELFNSSNGELVTWVRIPILSSTVDTVLYMYYCNPVCESQQYPERVWDSDYIMVQHMHGSDGITYDSTINDNDGIIYRATWTTGAIGQAIHFDGNSYVEFSPVIQLENDFSVEYWMKLEEYTTYPRVIGYDGHEYITEIWSPEYGLRMANSRIGDGNVCSASGNSNNWDDGNWYHIVITRKGVNVIFYYNAVDETYDGTTCSGLTERIRRIAGHGNSNDCFIGKIDEVRISNIERSLKWITTSYNTMNVPSSFFSVGPEESAP
jgi:hypothetical protein